MLTYYVKNILHSWYFQWQHFQLWLAHEVPFLFPFLTCKISCPVALLCTQLSLDAFSEPSTSWTSLASFHLFWHGWYFLGKLENSLILTRSFQIIWGWAYFFLINYTSQQIFVVSLNRLVSVVCLLFPNRFNIVFVLK